MGRVYRNFILPGTLTGIGAWLAFTDSAPGDYPFDASPAVTALNHGHIDAYLTARPAMGPLATLVEAPFALLGHGEPAHYEWVCMVGVIAMVVLGWCLARIARERGASEFAASAIALLCLVNPITVEAFRTGHPEELLTAALAVGAVLVAGRGHSLRAGLLLGLAVACKQWAVLATFPVLMALPGRRREAAGVAFAIVVAFMLPGFIASPGAFMDVQGNAASGGGEATIWSAWFPLAPVTFHTIRSVDVTVSVHEIPTALQPLTHPMLVATFLVVPFAVWRWNGTFRLDAERAIALFTLLALLRCVLDPVDNLYYHAPLLLGLIAWDAVRPIGRLPMRSLWGVVLLGIFWRWSLNLGDLDLFSIAYVAAATGAIALIASRLFEGREERVAVAAGRS